MEGERLPVLFVTGASRSGSTLLECLLGQGRGHFAAGELFYFWDRGLRDNGVCACGERFADCPVWSRVADRLGPPSAEQVEAVLAERDRLTPAWAVQWILRRQDPLAAVPQLARALEELLAAIREVTGAEAVIDSSKFPAHGLVLRRLPSVDLRVVHILRDPRAVAYSWSREAVYERRDGDTLLMGTLSPRAAAGLWRRWNLAAELLFSPLGDRYLRIRYEDFTARPREVAERAAALLDGAPGELPLREERTLELAPTHSVAGNRSRFRHGEVEVRRDEAWRRELPARQRLLVSLLTWPLSWRYGYLPGWIGGRAGGR